LAVFVRYIDFCQYDFRTVCCATPILGTKGGRIYGFGQKAVRQDASARAAVAPICPIGTCRQDARTGGPESATVFGNIT